jgi:hypothetical protein
VTGERLGQAGWPRPSKIAAQVAVAEAGFTSSSGGVRAPSVNANNGTWRREAIRNRFKTNQVTQASFELEPIAVTERVMVATVYQHGVSDSGGSAAAESAKRKTAKAGTK